MKKAPVNKWEKISEEMGYHGQTNTSADRKIYLDYNATTPLAPEVIQRVTDAMHEAWGNPSSSYIAGQKAKMIITEARESLAGMVGGRLQDIIFTSGGTEANNLVIYTAVKHFKEINAQRHEGENKRKTQGTHPHLIASCIEHDSVRLPMEHLVKEREAEATFVPVSKLTGQVEVDDVISAIRPTTCLVSIMLANNETGVIMPISQLSQKIQALNRKRMSSGLPRILVHTDAAQMIGKGRVDVQELGVDYLTIVGHKFYGPRIGALFVRGPGEATPLHPMLFGGGQERSFRPGTENTPMIAGLGKAAELVNKHCEDYEAHMRKIRDYLEERLEAVFEEQGIHFNCRLKGSRRLCNTCNFSILGPGLRGRLVLSNCKTLLASVGAACHSEKGDHYIPIPNAERRRDQHVTMPGEAVLDAMMGVGNQAGCRRPSAILLSSGIPYNVAQNALRLSVGRNTSKEDVDLIVEDLKEAVAQLQ